MLKMLGLTPPKGVVLIDDALDHNIDELYKMYLPKLSELKIWFNPINTDNLIKK